MKRPLPKRSNLFLMEMIMAILFFALAGMVCMQLFLKARGLSRDTTATNRAITLVKSVASTFEAGNGSLESLLDSYPYASLEDSTLEVFYDANWQPCDRKKYVYRMQMTVKEPKKNPAVCTITVTDSDKKKLFSLDASCYQPIKAVTN